MQIAAQSNGGLSYEKFVEAIAAEFDLTPDDLQVRIPSGAGKVKRNVEWAVHLLKKAGFLTAVSRGVHDATLDGQNYLRIHDGIITQHWLMKLAGQQTISVQKTSLDTKPLDLPVGGSHAPDGYIEHDATPDDVTPDEWIETSYRELLGKLIQDLLDAVKSVSPERFEQLVVDLLVKMGYGQGETVGRSGDGGIDGIIDQDALGLEKVYIQAKRWGSQVGEPEIRNFSGSLDPYGATKGVFITTSTFSSTARQTAQNISAGNKLIRLVDGDELARLMIRYGVGVVTETTYEVKKLDENYFAEDV